MTPSRSGLNFQASRHYCCFAVLPLNGRTVDRDHQPDYGKTREVDSVSKCRGLAMLEQQNRASALQVLLQVLHS